MIGLWSLLVHPAFAFFEKKEITAYWQTHSEDSSVEIDHTTWGELLVTYVMQEDGVNLFDYGAVTKRDRHRLQQYLDLMQAVKVTELNSAEQQPYWINLYNALTVWVILEHYPVDSILDISYQLLTRGPWSEALVEVEQQKLSLDNIEHDILRPIFKDNRIHYAVNCASYSCPNLQSEPFTRNNLERLLERSASDYIRHKRAVHVQGGKLVVSRIYDWYRDDFGVNDEDIIVHLRKYAHNDLVIQLKDIVIISGYEYDWSLNEPMSD